jgi:hypothetical protein
MESHSSTRPGGGRDARCHRRHEADTVTDAEVGGRLRDVALGRVDLGVLAGVRLCVLPRTRAEWTGCEVAALTGDER